MKKVQLFMLPDCPYCLQAFRWMDELYAEHPEYRMVPLETIDEGKNPDIANQYDYYYVPTYYVDGEKITEGVQTKDKIEGVFRLAMQSA